MITRLTVRNFKRFDEVDIELGKAVVLIGPNNSGKITALQAIALWDIGVRRWNEKRKGKTSPEKRSGVTINRRDLVSIPVPNANLLWRDLRVRDIKRIHNNSGKSSETHNVRVEIVPRLNQIGKNSDTKTLELRLFQDYYLSVLLSNR